MDTSKKFDGRAKDYTAGRPSYPSELIDRLYDRYGFSKNSVIADVGSGTGKFARLLLERDSEVYCVEPNDDMRLAAKDELRVFAGYHSVNGDSENTSLGSGSVDFVTSAQAFHWFDTDRFRAECRRILKTGGIAVLVWNIRDMSAAINRELYDLFKAYCPEFRGFGGGIKKDDESIVSFFSGNYERISFAHPLFYDKERYTARCLSGSYSLKQGDERYNEYIRDMEHIFDKYACGGEIVIENSTVAYIGKP
ncbi:class I SAM-dependent methyltransferase [Ruminococcus albus]|uniref:Methyltransferase domain-containing protein n=1 Tax=Ruminococcus albus TaxID=1264 RepID=A0A1I1PUW3_RUMAL|nr:class I SAM-dependent methyltransferase [Ruminococcus albus]SFD11398.1 Methyltransferase domain-containing protein [Ruminococcus albus]